jgi:hypothetical protein
MPGTDIELRLGVESRNFAARHLAFPIDDSPAATAATALTSITSPCRGAASFALRPCSSANFGALWRAKTRLVSRSGVAPKSETVKLRTVSRRMRN